MIQLEHTAPARQLNVFITYCKFTEGTERTENYSVKAKNVKQILKMSASFIQTETGTK